MQEKKDNRNRRVIAILTLILCLTSSTASFVIRSIAVRVSKVNKNQIIFLTLTEKAHAHSKFTKKYMAKISFGHRNAFLPILLLIPALRAYAVLVEGDSAERAAVNADV